MTRSKPVTYFNQKYQTTSRSIMLQQLQDAPIKKNEVKFMIDVMDGMQLKELSEKYNLSISRIVKWKRDICTKLLRYDMLQHSMQKFPLQKTADFRK